MTSITAPAPTAERVARRRQLTYALRQPSIAIGAVVLLLFLVAAAFAPLLSPNDPMEQDIVNGLKPPSAEHLLGTDKLGREILSRLLYGARISLFVGFSVVVLAGTLGTLLGLIAGYVGGWA